MRGHKFCARLLYSLPRLTAGQAVFIHTGDGGKPYKHVSLNTGALWGVWRDVL